MSMEMSTNFESDGEGTAIFSILSLNLIVIVSDTSYFGVIVSDISFVLAMTVKTEEVKRKGNAISERHQQDTEDEFHAAESSNAVTIEDNVIRNVDDLEDDSEGTAMPSISSLNLIVIVSDTSYLEIIAWHRC